MAVIKTRSESIPRNFFGTAIANPMPNLQAFI